jgi:hypothetical protein
MNNKSVSLKSAIFDVVVNFANRGNKFSSHDITRKLRSDVNSGKIEIPEIATPIGADAFLYDVKHQDVKSSFLELVENDQFRDYKMSSVFNGLYYEYEFTKFALPTPVATPAPAATPAPVATSPTNQISITSSVIPRIVFYLSNCKTRGVSPSIKQVQSAIKRGNHSSGVSSSELMICITRNLGYSVQKGKSFKSSFVNTKRY